jgi:hypothetical protein
VIAFRDELEEFARFREATDPESRRRGGRPRLPTALRTEPFSLRLTPDERHLVAAAARIVGGGEATATWARAALVEAARRLLQDDQAPRRTTAA